VPGTLDQVVEDPGHERDPALGIGEARGSRSVDPNGGASLGRPRGDVQRSAWSVSQSDTRPPSKPLVNHSWRCS
jgi:hypothetical protein